MKAKGSSKVNLANIAKKPGGKYSGSGRNLGSAATNDSPGRNPGTSGYAGTKKIKRGDKKVGGFD